MCAGTPLPSLQSMPKRYWGDSRVKSAPEADIVQSCVAFGNVKAIYFPEGLSVAGSQKGLDDDRSNLVKEIFKVFDRMPNGFGPEL